MKGDITISNHREGHLKVKAERLYRHDKNDDRMKDKSWNSLCQRGNEPLSRTHTRSICPCLYSDDSKYR